MPFLLMSLLEYVMTLSVVKAEIERFLRSEEAEVLVLKGGWGTGKTFTWKKLIAEFVSRESLPTIRYSYVSLFGVNSLQDFKFLLFQQSVPNSTIGNDPSISAFRENALGFSETFARKGFNWFAKLPILKDFSSEVRSLAFLSIKKTLVCVDDFERKAKELEARDVLGLISQLKEEKGCKVVLIMNDGGLDEADFKEFEKYREKVIDIELGFDPNVEECISIGLDSEDELDRKLEPKLLKLGIKNIRVIFRIKRLIRIVLPHLREFEPEILDQAIHTIALFSWCYLSDDSVSPNYDFVKNSGLKLMGLSDDEISDVEKAWSGILQDYGFISVDEFDLVLADVVETGYVNPNSFSNPLSALNAQLLANKGEKSFSEAWHHYHDSFDNNQEEVINLIYERFRENVKYISALNLNGTVSLLRELGRDDLADTCISHYIENRRDEPKLFDLDSYSFAGDITDKRLRQEFNRVHIDIAPQKSLRETVREIAGKNGWGRRDIEVMAEASEDDYYELFKTEQGRHLHSFVNACLQFKRIQGTSDRERSISDNAEAALRRIATESKVNRRRVAIYGIHIEDAT